LRTVIATRSFAGEIGLEVGGQYTSYVPWTGDRIITTLVVTEPGELDARPFVFPIVGSVPYKGFFDRSLAEDQAENFRDQGFDVCLTPITAYSTLGFFDDPVSAPMLRASQGRLVETLLHEFVHATFFVESEPGFNEGAALFIGQEASVLFFVEVPEKAHRRRQEVQDARLLAQFLLEFQRQIQALYAEADDPAERGRRRAVAEQAVRIQLAELPFSAYDGKKLAASLKLNDACLALRGTYTEDLPLFERALAGHQNDLKAFIAAVRTAAESEEARESLFDPSRSDPDR
jgi:predicted aminopeptidase